MRSLLRWAFGLAPVIGLLAAALWIAPLALFALRPIGETASVPAESFVLVPRGATPATVLQELETAGINLDRRQLLALARLKHTWRDLKSGEYRITDQQTPIELLETLASGVSVKRPVTIREGENLFEIAARIEQAGLASKARIIELCRDPAFVKKVFDGVGFSPATLEGFLFPDTYAFNRLQTPEEMLEQMHRRYRQVWAEIQKKPGTVLQMTQFEIITLASIIEKETGAPDERRLISSVFHNRLKKRMRLQSDPTTIYGIWEQYDGNIRKKDLQAFTPYNTYKVPALPAGPISNPGAMAIEAALNPAVSDYLFFVSKNDGHHVFTRSYGEHRSAVVDFQLNRSAREGKSWRDLNRSSAPKN